ncbi:hypothetical protein [Desulfobacter curvatus]|uniref:hypothetical protein n=1 Tax=Desulfobacter curvatus TaxID=2290 RepID=UPI0003608068|nr:hypothetical protein [Desulfobacter curvatus]
MIHKNLFILCVVGALVFCGCGITETVIQKEKVSYLNFTGDTVGAIVCIDDLEPIVLNNEKNAHYEISSGKHHVIVIKNGAEVVNRKVLLGSGSSKEIRIPWQK